MILWWFVRGASGVCREHQVQTALMFRAVSVEDGPSEAQFGETKQNVSLTVNRE